MIPRTRYDMNRLCTRTYSRALDIGVEERTVAAEAGGWVVDLGVLPPVELEDHVAGTRLFGPHVDGREHPVVREGVDAGQGGQHRLAGEGGAGRLQGLDEQGGVGPGGVGELVRREVRVGLLQP